MAEKINPNQISIKDVIEDLVAEFGLLSNAADTDATYILSDGRILGTKGTNDQKSQHVNIAKYIEKVYGVKDLENDGSHVLNRVNAIRVTPWIPAFYLPIKTITTEQEEALYDFMQKIRGKVNSENPLMVSLFNGSQQVEFTSVRNPYNIIDSIYGYYMFGQLLSENLQEKIVKIGSKWQVQSEKGRNMGTYDTKEEAEERLRQVHYFKYAKEALNEDTRNQLIAKSRNAGPYKDTSRGKNRFERKKHSHIANQTKSYNQIDMNDFFKKDLLQVKIPVTGETNTYTVTIKLDGVCSEMQKNIKNNQNKLEYRTIIQAITKVFNTSNVYVKCTCADFQYRFDHWSIVNNYGVDDTAHDPGPGKGIANPNNDKGIGCKHILLVLANGAWIMKVASVINNYIHYAEEHMQKPFLKVIFPKLYGIEAEEMVEQDLIDDDKYLDSSAGLIDAINDYGRTRGQYKKGSNKNPITGTGGKSKKTTTAVPEEEKEENK